MTKNNFMKKLLLPIIVVLITLSGCQKKVNFRKEKEYIKEENNITYYKGTPFSGVFEGYFENGQLETKTTYKEGKLNGLYESYHENGQLETKTTYKEGKLNGSIEIYWKNGQLEIKTTYKEGGKDGPYESYYYNGQLRVLIKE